jgi:SPP1 gp7 family putative phage head morphogenesis protein
MEAVSTITNKLTEFSDDDAEKIIQGVYAGTINVYDLPVKLYNYYITEFIKAIDEFFEDVTDQEEIVLRNLLYENVQLFSGAKTFQMIKDFESFLIEDGKPVEYQIFRKRVLEVYEDYNKTWLKTEYEYAVESARAGKRWIGIWKDKEIFPLLEYVTVGDSRVREAHKMLDGVIRPVEDKFWNSYYPPWSWRCRCTVKKLEDGKITEIKNKTVVLPEIDKFFKNNVGKTGKIFNRHHPYFKHIPEKYKEWAKLNFGLPFIRING